MKLASVCAIIILLLVSETSDAQTSYFDSLRQAKKVRYDSARKDYIQTWSDKFYIKPILTVRFLNLIIDDENRRANEIVYSPSSNNFFGFGLYAFDLGVELSFKLPQNEEETPKEIFGETESFDFQTNIYAKKWGADISFQRYSSMYMEDPASHYADWIPGEPYPIREDLALRYFQLNGFYLFNHERFSLRSPYVQADRQLKRQGSFLLSMFVSTFSFSADSTLIPESAKVLYPENEEFRMMRTTTLALLPGYTYTLAKNHFYVNASFSLGPGHLWIKYNRGDFEKEDIKFRPVLGLRGAIGYNGEKFFAGITTNAKIVSTKIDNLNVNSRSGNIKIFFGLRLQEFGVLKKELF
uniref:DUF4421 family protein n=1 Tax=Fulvivirga sp. TaxID=1931237 RepID=UPI0040499A6C